jgi:hypothetical protein
VDVARKDLSDRSTFDGLPFDRPALLTGKFDPFEQLLGYELLVEPRS